MKYKIVQRKLRGKTDSFWYDGCIAKIKDYALIATGEIRVCFNDKDYDNDEYRDYHAIEEAERRKYKDKNMGDWTWENNNWFEVIKVNKEGKMIDCELGDVAYDYDEGIRLLLDYYKEKYYERR